MGRTPKAMVELDLVRGQAQGLWLLRVLPLRLLPLRVLATDRSEPRGVCVRVCCIWLASAMDSCKHRHVPELLGSEFFET